MLELDHVTFQYGPGLPLVLDDVSLSVGKGEFIAVTGRNGSGKTTITRLLTGLEKPVKGRILYNGKNVTEEDPSRRSRFIGYVFQQPDRQMFMPTVREEVAFGPYHQGKRGAELENAIDRALEATDTKRLENEYPRTLSRGEQQRVAIASALAMDTEYLVLDEPTSGQDGKERKRLVTLIRDLQEQGISILLITHDMDIVAGACGRVIVVAHSKIVFDGKPEILFSEEGCPEQWGLAEMQNRYGTSSGLFSWGDLTDKRYDPKDFFNTGSNIINSITLSTGSDKNQTYFSASTTNSDGILPNNSYNRYNFTARNTTNFLNDKLTLDIGAQYIIQNNTNMVSQGQYYNPLPALYLFPRGDNFDEIRLYERYDTNYGFMKQYWPYGDGGLSLQNPYWTQNRIRRTSDKKRYMLNASLKWKVTDWLNITGRVNLDNSDYRNKTEKYASTLATFCSVNGGFEDAMRQERSLYTDLMATVDKTFGDFRLNTNIGMSLYHTSMQTIGFAGDLIIPNFFALNNINYAANYKPLPDGYDDEVQSIFANVELGWRSQLYLTLTGRNDWDSKLAFSNQSSYFYPSVGLSAVLTEMFALPKIISYAKVRGSYTVVASSFDRYLTNPGYEYNSQTHNWANPTVYPMDNLKPEKTKSWEIGLNLKFWENRFNLDATYYRSNTLNQTFKVDIPSSSGYNKAIVQTGNEQNQGIELALGFTDEWAGFRWASNATFTLNRNKVKRLAGGSTNPVTGELIDMPNMPVGWLGKENVAPRVILTEGGTMTDIYVYNELTKDNNGNIKVDAQTGGLSMHTAETPTKVGNLNANYNLGWTNNFTYKGINLGVVLSARVGGLAYSATQGVLDYYGVSSITANARDNKGVPMNNGKVDTQKYYQTIGTGEGGYGRYYLYSATNVRLQELSLSYTLPKKWLNNVANVTFGLVGRNLWMIYCKAPFDPELSASTSSNYYMNVDYFMQPSMRNIGFNVKVQF